MATTHPSKEAPPFGGPNYRFIDLTAHHAADTFADDIARGLAAEQKYIRSMHMYDADYQKDEAMANGVRIRCSRNAPAVKPATSEGYLINRQGNGLHQFERGSRGNESVRGLIYSPY